MRLLSYNIRYGGSGREEKLSAVIRDSAADLVILQEATKPQVVEQLARATGMRVWGARAGHSVAFMSRMEIVHHDWHLLPGARRAFLEVVPAGTEMRVFGLHLSAIHSNWTERRRVRELHALLESIKRHQDGFHVLAGDFNTLAPGELLDERRLPFRLRTLLWMSGRRIRWETIQIMLDADYVDGYRILHPGESGFTFPAFDPHIRLDYMFVPRAFIDRIKSCQIVNDNVMAAHASDHFPLLAELELG